MGLSLGFHLDGMTGPGSGTWSRLSSLVSALAEAGNDVHLSGSYGLHDAARDFDVASVTLKRAPSKFERVAGRATSLTRFARDRGLDIIHLEAPPYIGIRSTPTIASLHDARHYDPSSTRRLSMSSVYHRKILGGFSPNISAWLALSGHAKSEICRNIGIPEEVIHVFPPIIDRPQNVPTETPPGLTGKKPFVLVLGHLEPRKNIETIVKATSHKNWPQDLELWVAGKDRGSLSALTKLASDLRTRFRFLDSPSEAEKWYLLGAARIVAVPSLVEGFGIVAVEATLANTVTLVSDATATIELAGDPSASVPALDERAWANAVARVHRSETLRKRLGSAQQSIAKEFSREAVLPNLNAIYQQILNPIRDVNTF